jgi:hypothetical protein
MGASCSSSCDLQAPARPLDAHPHAAGPRERRARRARPVPALRRRLRAAGDGAQGEDPGKPFTIVSSAPS